MGRPLQAERQGRPGLRQPDHARCTTRTTTPATARRTRCWTSSRSCSTGRSSRPRIIQQPITGGSGQINGGTGGFTQAQSTKLANVLKYGALPLTFHTQSVTSVSAELGSAQLHAALVAARIGLLLVVVYSFLYYRGLGLVSVFSLAIAALLSYLAVVLLSKYQGFTLTWPASPA